MHIYGHETERIHQLQRQLQAEEQFRAAVREMRLAQRRAVNAKRRQSDHSAWREEAARLAAVVDRELSILDNEGW